MRLERTSRAERRDDRWPEDEEGASGTLRRLLAEFLGTFALTFAAAGGEVFAKVSGGEVGPAARAVAPGLTVMALIYAIGNVSGAHFNPAVTFGFALRGAFPWKRVPGYWLAELGGAIGAGLVLKILFGNVAHLGTTLPRHGQLPSFGIEIILTWLLLTVILGTATRYRLIGPNAALAVGATIALDGLFAEPISGASMNPARSLGPAIVANYFSPAWIYVAGPFIGASIAVGITQLLHGPERESVEAEVARGEDGKRPASRKS